MVADNQIQGAGKAKSKAETKAWVVRRGWWVPPSLLPELRRTSGRGEALPRARVPSSQAYAHPETSAFGMTAGKRILVFRSAFRIFILSSRSLSGVSKGRDPHLNWAGEVLQAVTMDSPSGLRPVSQSESALRMTAGKRIPAFRSAFRIPRSAFAPNPPSG
jgi:hypothetical protein